MASKEVNLFQIWKVYQRRAESLGHYFDMRIEYYHFAWEERSKLHKAVSYIFKSLGTIRDIVKYRPGLIFLQLPPTPALYLVGLYGALKKTPYIVDCHNDMFMGWWIRWPLAKHFLRKATAVLVHNSQVQKVADGLGIKTIVMRDPLPQVPTISGTGVLDRFELVPHKYVIVPWNLAPDEPIAEFIEAVRQVPDIKFAMTWFTERLPENLRVDLPSNLVFTGYLKIDEFNELFAKSGAAISLTIRSGTQPSAASEAIAFGVPIILSDTETARLLYGDTPAFVENTPKSIVEGVLEVLGRQEYYAEKVDGFRETLRNELEKEIECLKAQIF